MSKKGKKLIKDKVGVLEVYFNGHLKLRQHILNEKNYTLGSTFEPTTPYNAESYAKCLQTIALKFVN